jgi:hypothetical protein
MGEEGAREAVVPGALEPQVSCVLVLGHNRAPPWACKTLQCAGMACAFMTARWLVACQTSTRKY